MENYTKYKLKTPEELAELTAGIDSLFVIACNKCFGEFSDENNTDLDAFLAFAREQGKSISGTASIDFLCNKIQTEKKISGLIPENTQSIAVLSCGLGVQTLAAFVQTPVIAACDSLNYHGSHGMALTKKACDACAQCYLNLTGGICPIVDCSKSLLNGQCGGAKNGKCEVDPNHDCAWEKIYRRLEKQGRLEEFLAQPVEFRDYSRVNHKEIQEYVSSIREKRLDGYYGGVHPAERKELAEKAPLIPFPAPETVVLPLSQHIGKPAVAVVKAGDHVNVGQLIGEADGYISSPIHSSVSGTVLAVGPRLHPVSGVMSPAVVIRSDGKDTLDPSVKPHAGLDSLSPEEIFQIVRDSGIVGMGGATFPTAVKLKPGKPVDTVLLNGCECEPLITADHKVLLEYPDEILFGLRAIMKAAGAGTGIIVIEDNKPDAIELLSQKAEDFENISVAAVRTKYPQGAEKMLIKRVLGRQVPSGGLPADVGAIVCNVSTAKAISDAITLGMPLVERVVSVTGERIKKPGNYIVKIGTSVQDLIEYCGGITGEDAVLKIGGPMMGIRQNETDVPILKGANGVVAVDPDETVEQPCIKCGRCADVCPMELLPLWFAKYADENNAQGLREKNVADCIECRSCEYICSSKIPLLEKIRAGKAAVRGMK